MPDVEKPSLTYLDELVQINLATDKGPANKNSLIFGLGKSATQPFTLEKSMVFVYTCLGGETLEIPYGHQRYRVDTEVSTLDPGRIAVGRYLTLWHGLFLDLLSPAKSGRFINPQTEVGLKLRVPNNACISGQLEIQTRREARALIMHDPEELLVRPNDFLIDRYREPRQEPTE